MLPKIIYKNFKSNIKNYILFFISNIIAVAELFVFWGLNDVVMRAVMDPSVMMGIKSDFMIAVSLVTMITVLLMVFSMKYYIKLRARDYSTFIMLGMKKKTSYLLLFGEYVIGCLGSLGLGFLAGNSLLYGLLRALHRYDPEKIAVSMVGWKIYRNTAGLCLGVMFGIFIILLVWMDGRDLSMLMMKEEEKEKRPVSSKWLLLTVLGIAVVLLAVRQYNPGTWGYYFSHVEFVAGGFLIVAFGGGFVLERVKKRRFYLHYVLKINQLESKYQSNMLIILILFAVHFFALSYIGIQIAQLLPLDKNSGNYPYDTVWMAQQKDMEFSEEIAEKYGGTVRHVPMIRATMFYSQEEIGISESAYRELTGKSYGLKGKEIAVGIEDQDYVEEKEVKDRVLLDLFGWLYIGKYNPGKEEFSSSKVLYDRQHRYEIKEMHTQNLFGKFTLEEAGEVGEDTVIFSDGYFEDQWREQAADTEEVSMLELFAFPEETEYEAWKEIRAYADKNGVKVFQPDPYHTQHAVCYNRDVFLKGQKMSTLFLLSSKLFILITLFVSGIFIMAVKNLSELSAYARRYEFLNSMGMKRKAQKKNLSFEIQSPPGIALAVGACLAVVYALTEAYWYILNGQKLAGDFWKYWCGIAAVYIVTELIVQRLFAEYIYKRLKKA